MPGSYPYPLKFLFHWSGCDLNISFGFFFFLALFKALQVILIRS